MLASTNIHRIAICCEGRIYASAVLSNSNSHVAVRLGVEATCCATAPKFGAFACVKAHQVYRKGSFMSVAVGA
jgi:hypothetical protein